MTNEQAAWTYSELIEQLAEYERQNNARGLRPITVASYGRYARWFLLWCVGQWWPPSRAPRPSPRLLTDRADKRRGRRPGPWVSGSSMVPPVPPKAAIPAPPAEDGDAWPSERSVQSSIVAWLVGEGWSITRVADTRSREHGVDVSARRGAATILVEVKGHPSELYAAGERAGQRRRWDPNSQARTYFGDALLAVLRMRDANPAARIGLALPAKATFVGLVDQVESSLSELRLTVFLVDAAGEVRVRIDQSPP